MGISIWQLLIVLLIVLLLFGAKRLRTIGTDLGAAIKGFRESMKDAGHEEDAEAKKVEQLQGGRVIDAETNRAKAPEGRVIDAEASREKDRT